MVGGRFIQPKVWLIVESWHVVSCDSVNGRHLEC